MGIIRITRNNLPRYAEQLRELEQIADYPIGDDRFKIDHGADYFRFFERLGELYYFATLDRGRIVAVGCSMLRTAPMRQGDPPRKCWYGGDVKVHPDYRRRHLPMKMAYRHFLPLALRCLRGYVISMNPNDGRPNPIIKLAKHFRWLPVKVAGVLFLYSLDAEQMRELAPTIAEHRGPLSYLSLAGIKDIVLQSTGAPMPLLHVQFGPCAGRGQAEPQAGSVHMFCAMAADPLAHAMSRRQIEPAATASVIASGMDECDFRFVLTSDI